MNVLLSLTENYHLVVRLCGMAVCDKYSMMLLSVCPPWLVKVMGGVSAGRRHVLLLPAWPGGSLLLRSVTVGTQRLMTVIRGNMGNTDKLYLTGAC